MKPISWDDFDGLTFQKLCNGILLFSVSKFSQVFSDAGKDGGIDQSFTGTYDGKTGRWRFQDKFHHSGKATADISELKRDIASDIRTNYKGEDFIVFMTNVSLSPQKLAECMTIATMTLKEKGIPGCEVMIWHSSVIETLLFNLPIIYNWFWESDSVLLQPYQEYFAKQLEETTELRNQLFNPFFGRENELETMKQFLARKDTSTLALVANGGYGKTRLTIEFIKTQVDQNDDWIALVLSHVGFNPSHFKTLLQSRSGLIVIIDDTHEIPEITAEVKRMIDNTKGAAKLLLTTRPALFSDIQNKIPSHIQQPEKLLLEKLDYDKTKLMFADALPGVGERNILYLSQISKGVPNVILELIRLVKTGKQPQEISGEGIFTNSVVEIFRQAISDVEKKTTISQSKSFDFVRLVALISPVKNNQDGRKFIADTLEIREDQLEHLITEFVGLNLMEESSVISVKPDPYSDVLVVETFTKSKSFITHIWNRPGAEEYLENMLKNLMEAEIPGADKNHFIDGFLNGYLQLVDDNFTGAKKIKDIFKFVEIIALYKPSVATQLVGKFLDWQKDPDHRIHQIVEPWASAPFVSELKELAQNILKKLCSYSDYPRTNKEETHELVERLALQANDFKVINFCYGYHEWDFPYYGYRVKHCSERQLYLKNKICAYLADPTTTTFQIEFSLAAADMLLQHEFQLDSYFDSHTMQMHFGHGHVPDCKHTREIRMSVIAALITFMESPTPSVHKEKAFNLLLHEIFFCATGYERRYKQNLKEEVDVVLNFFERFLDSQPSSQHKNAIRTQIMVYERGEYKEEYRERIIAIKEKASAAASLSEELELHLLNDDYFDAKDHLQERVLALISKHRSFNDFQVDLMRLRLKLGDQPSNFSVILNMIGNHYPAEAKIFFSSLQKDYPEMMPSAVELIKHFYKERDYFYSIIDWLWQRKEETLDLVLWLLGWGRNRDRTSYEKRDLEYYSHLVSQKPTDGRLCDMISYNLIDYAYIDKERTFAMLNDFLSFAPRNQIQNFQFTLFDNKATYGADFPQEIKTLLYANPQSIDLENVLNNGLLRFFEEQFGFDEVFAFVLHWVDSELARTEYRYFHFDRQTYTGDATTTAEKIERFKTILRWYISMGNDAQKDKKTELIITLFRPDANITEEIRIGLLPLIEEYKDDSKALLLMAEGLQTFSNNSDQWILMMCTVVEAIIAKDNEKINFIDVFGRDFVYNMGSKSKQGRGVPYDEDEAKKAMLEKLLTETTFSDPVSNFLNSMLKKVDQDIAEEIEEDKRRSEW